MKLYNLILWLTVGTIVGWLANWMAEEERRAKNSKKTSRLLNQANTNVSHG